MATAIIVTYLGLGAVTGIAILFFNGPRGLKLADQPIDRILEVAAFKRRFNSGVWSRVQWVGYKLLPALIYVIAWPAALALLMPRSVRAGGFRQRMWTAMLMPLCLLIALSFAGFSLLLVAMQMLNAASWALDLGCFLVLVGLLADLISNMASPTEFPASMRRNRMQPYIQFIIMATLQYLTLLAVALLLTHLRRGGHLTFDAVIDEVGDLAVFSHFFEAVTTAQNSTLGILLTLAGVAFFATIVRLLLQYRRFIREPADHAHIVMSLTRVGRFCAARQWLDSIDTKTRNDSSMVTPRILLLTGENDYAGAYRLTEVLFGLNSDDQTVIYSTSTIDDILCSLVGMSRMIDLEPGQYRQLITFACARGMSDGCLSLDLPHLLEQLRISRVAELVSLGVSLETYPISLSLSKWILTDVPSEEDEARLQLASFAPALETDKIAQIITDCRMHIYHDDDFSGLLQNALDLISRASKLPGWSRWALSLALDEVAESRTLSRELQARTRQCEIALLEGVNGNERELSESLKFARRNLSG